MQENYEKRSRSAKTNCDLLVVRSNMLAAQNHDLWRDLELYRRIEEGERAPLNARIDVMRKSIENAEKEQRVGSAVRRVVGRGKREKERGKEEKSQVSIALMDTDSKKKKEKEKKEKKKKKSENHNYKGQCLIFGGMNDSSVTQRVE
jgi:septum formation inhibitor MinC